MATQEGYLGLRERYISAEESSYGVAVSLASAKNPGTNMTIAPTFTQGFQEVTSAGTDQRTIVKRVAGGLTLDYNLTYNPITWERLKYMFDIDSETGSDPYTHTLSVGNTQLSFTSEWAMRHDTDPLIWKLTGNVVKQLTIDWQKSSGEGNDGFVRCTEQITAQNYSEPSLQAGDFALTGDPFQYRHAKVTLNSSEVIPINNGQLVMTQGINPNDSRYTNTTLGRTIGTPISTVFRINGRFNLNLFETTFNDLWAAAAALSGTNTIEFEQSAGNKITFTLSGVTVEPVPMAGTNLEGINTGDFVFVATGIVPVAIDSVANW